MATSASALRFAACLALTSCALANVDVVLAPNRASPPAECPNGCARWSDLASDGNTRAQADVDAKFRYGIAPAVRACASPAYDPGESGPGWCYCRGLNNAEWGYCLDPVGSVPEQINLQFVDDAGRTTISFVTIDNHARGGPPIAQVGSSPDAASASNITGVTNFWTQVGSSRAYSFHFVPLTGLAPATTHFYRVASGAPGAQWSAWYAYTTRDPTATLRIAIAGDVGPYPVNHFDLLANASVATDATHIDLVLHMGDHAYQMSSDDGARGDLYLIAFEAVLTQVPWLAVMGNHEEYNGAYFMRYLNQTAGQATLTPRSDSSGAGGRWFSVDIGLLHLVVLDFNVYYGSEPDALRVAQLAFLESDLAAVDRVRTPWILVTAHMPVMCSSITLDGEFADQSLRFRVDVGGEDAATVAAGAPYKGCTGTGPANTEASRKDVEPLFIKYGVDLFACGHEHNAESMWPTRDLVPTAFDFNAPKATVYVVEGAGGAPTLDLFGGPAPFTRTQDSSWGFGRITVHNASHLTYERVQNDRCRQQCQDTQCPECGVPAGTVSDSWTIVQPSHGSFDAP